MFDIIIDHRESRSPVMRALQAHPDVNCTIRELSCGDYLVHETFAIERKDANDFVLSIMDRRLFSQLKRLKDEYPRVTFLVEGNPYATRSAIQPAAIRGALSYLMAIEGVSLMMLPSVTETAETLVTLARHCQEGLGYDVSLRADKPKDFADLAQYLVEGLPGIGASTAKVLIAHFGSAMAVFMAPMDKLCEVPGIGKKSAQRMREALDHVVASK